jgi:hypothetical protein
VAAVLLLLLLLLPLLQLLMLTMIHVHSPVAVVFIRGACHHVIISYNDAVVPLHEVLLAAMRCIIMIEKQHKAVSGRDAYNRQVSNSSVKRC